MAQRQRPPVPETQKETQMDRLIEQLRDMVNRIPIVNLTPQQRETLREMLHEVLRQLNEAQQQSRPMPRIQRSPARTEAYFYDVSLAGRTYRVGLPERLPRDPMAAQARLHDLLLNNRLVEPGGAIVHSDVRMQGTGAETFAFNGRPPNARLDDFRDSYLARTSSGGGFVGRPDVRIAEVAPAESRRSRGL